MDIYNHFNLLLTFLCKKIGPFLFGLGCQEFVYAIWIILAFGLFFFSFWIGGLSSHLFLKGQWSRRANLLFNGLFVTAEAIAVSSYFLSYFPIGHIYDPGNFGLVLFFIVFVHIPAALGFRKELSIRLKREVLERQNREQIQERISKLLDLQDDLDKATQNPVNAADCQKSKPKIFEIY